MNRTFVITVRRATPADAGGIAACLRVLGYPSEPAAVLDKLGRVAGSTADAVFVATGGPPPDLLGVASVHVVPLFHVPGHLLRLTSLAVREDAQRCGVGRALVAAAEAYAWESDCVRIEITSGAQRTGAHAFYEALGFEPASQRFVRHRPE